MKSATKSKLPSILSLILIAFIFFTSYFGRSWLRFLLDFVSRDFLSASLVIFFAFAAYRLKLHKHKLTILLLLCAMALAYKFMLPEELVHIIYFGSLGWLLSKDARKGRSAAAMIGIAIAVGLGDEAFQLLLPWRVADRRDVAINFFSLVAGAMLHRAQIRGLLSEKL